MKAYVLHGISDLRYEKINRPTLQPGQVLVKVQAAGICGSDIPRIYRTGAYHHPMTPGHEFSGLVVEVGEGVSREWEDKRVGIFPLIPCMGCSACRKQKYEMCSHYNYLGSRTDGGFAEYVAVPQWNLIELPIEVTYEQAAMLEPMAVAVHAIRQSGLMDAEGNPIRGKEKMSIAVCGLGTIGLFIVMLLKSLQYDTVYTMGNKDSQLYLAEKLGVSKECYCDVRNTETGNWLIKKTQGEGVDVFFECVGKNEVLTQGIDSVSPGGIVVIVGNPAGDMALEKAVYWKIVRRQITIQGTWNSSFTHNEDDDWHYVLNALKDGKIHPEQMITHRFPLNSLNKGFELMRDKSEDYVKVMGIFS